MGWDSRGKNLVPFVVEFDPINNLVKILDPKNTDPNNKTYPTLRNGYSSEITKKDIFDSLIDY